MDSPVILNPVEKLKLLFLFSFHKTEALIGRDRILLYFMEHKIGRNFRKFHAINLSIVLPKPSVNCVLQILESIESIDWVVENQGASLKIKYHFTLKHGILLPSIECMDYISREVTSYSLKTKLNSKKFWINFYGL